MTDKPDLPFQCWVKAQRTNAAAYVVGSMYALSTAREVVSSVGFVPKKGQKIHWASWPERRRHSK